MKFLLDSNTFIEAKNRYYGMSFCPAYWDWLLVSNKSNDIASINFVKSELLRGKDELTEWVKSNSHLFINEDDGETQSAYREVATHVTSLSQMKAGAHEEFLNGADPWLISKAMSTGATVVTHESYNPDNKKKVLIPNICEYFGVDYIDTFKLLNDLDAKFVMHE